MAEIDPCVEAERLRALHTAMIGGEQISEGRFGEDTLKFSKGDPSALLREIQRLEDLCAAQSETKPRRRARAVSGRYRHPY